MRKAHVARCNEPCPGESRGRLRKDQHPRDRNTMTPEEEFKCDDKNATWNGMHGGLDGGGSMDGCNDDD